MSNEPLIWEYSTFATSLMFLVLLLLTRKLMLVIARYTCEHKNSFLNLVWILAICVGAIPAIIFGKVEMDQSRVLGVISFIYLLYFGYLGSRLMKVE